MGHYTRDPSLVADTDNRRRVLQLDDAYAFEERPQTLNCSFAIFRESPRKMRRQKGPKDKWLNSGGEKGSTFWPSGSQTTARIRCKYGKVDCVDGRELRYCEFTLCPAGNPGLSEEHFARHLWQVRLAQDRRKALSGANRSNVPDAAHRAAARPAASASEHRAAARSARPAAPAAFSRHMEHGDQIAQEPAVVSKQSRGNASKTRTDAAAKKPSMKRKRKVPDFTPKVLPGPVCIRGTRPASAAMGSRLLDLDFVGRAADHADEFEMQDLKYMSFTSEGEEVGSLSTSSEGLKLTTAAGDFAEWHELSDQAETLEEGDVVGICRGKVSRRTAHAAMVGVVTEKAAVVGSLSRWTSSRHRTGAEIAYCGRVPVRVRGPVREGDILVSSGREDGMAVVISNSTAASRDCEISCTTEPRAIQQGLQVGVAMQTCDQPQDRVSLVEVAVTGPSMSSSSMQHLARNRGAVCTIRAVVFATLFVAVLSTVAVWLAVRSIPPHQQPSTKPFQHRTLPFFDEDDSDLFPRVNVLTELVCLAGLDRRPESLKHLPCYVYQPRKGMPGTTGVFQPVGVSNCDHGADWARDGNNSLTPGTCWELQYGNSTAAFSDDPFYEKLYLVERQTLPRANHNQQPTVVRNRDPFRCEDQFPRNIWAACPDNNLTSCADLLPDDASTVDAEILCTSGQLQDLGFEPDGGPALLYEQGSKNPIDQYVYFRTICPETCALFPGWASGRRNARRSLGANGVINDTDDHAGHKGAGPREITSSFEFFNLPQRSGPPAETPATPTAPLQPATFSTWWLGGILKETANKNADGSDPLVPAEFLGDKPWLCLENAVVQNSSYGTHTTFELGVSSFQEGTHRSFLAVGPSRSGSVGFTI